METPPIAQEGTETLWTVKEVADLLQCSVRHVQNLQKRGLPYVALGRLIRFDPREVRDYILRKRHVG